MTQAAPACRAITSERTGDTNEIMCDAPRAFRTENHAWTALTINSAETEI